MATYQNLIKKEAGIINQLNKNIHATFRNRNNNKSAWEDACSEFHTYNSAIYPYVDRLYSEKEIRDPDIIEFVITFLELDPKFFRSGYIKEEMLRKLKRAALNEKHKKRLRNILCDAVEKRGSREFRRYCRLAPIIAENGLIECIEKSATNSNNKIKSRAKLMLKYIRQQESMQSKSLSDNM